MAQLTHIGYTIQGHFLCGGFEADIILRDHLPKEQSLMVLEYASEFWAFYVSSLRAYESAWAYLYTQSTLTCSALLHAHKLLNTGKPSTFERAFTVRCGNVTFPPRTKMRTRIKWQLCNYRRTNNIAKLVHVLLHRYHIFGDGNGRVARLLIAWHYGRHLPLCCNRRERQRWYLAVSANSHHPLAQLIEAAATRSLTRLELYDTTYLDDEATVTSTTTTTTTTTGDNNLMDELLDDEWVGFDPRERRRAQLYEDSEMCSCLWPV